MYFFWVDCEMTGLNSELDTILEIACIMTDENMNILFEYQSYIYHDNVILDKMNDWCKKIHSESGLLNQVSLSIKNYTIVEDEILTLLKKYTVGNTVYIAGNSIYTDLYFIKKYMPKISDILHYRIFDISTFKILAEKKNRAPFIKKNKHIAIEDIKESILEYVYYEEVLLK